MKKHRISGAVGVAAIILVALFMSVTPSFATDKEARIAIGLWRVNGPAEHQYLKDALTDMLLSRLGSWPGIKVLRNDATDAQYQLSGSLSVLGDNFSIDARLVDLKTKAETPFNASAQGISSVIGLVDDLSSDVAGFVLDGTTKNAKPAKDAKAQAVKPVEAAKGKEKSPLRSKDMRTKFVGIAAGDFDKDGAKEVALISSRTLMILKITKGSFETIAELKSPDGAQNVYLSAYDSDNDGSAELFVSRVLANRANSAIVAYRDGSYKFVETGLPWLFKDALLPNNKTVLLGQGFRESDGFFGSVYKIERAGATLKAIEEYGTIPDGYDIYRAKTVDDLFGLDTKAVLALDNRGRLRVFRDDSVDPVWRGTERYGGTLNAIEVEGYAGGTSYAIEGRSYYIDIDADNQNEAIVKRNVPGGLGESSTRPLSFGSGSIAALRWDGTQFNEVWRTKEASGYIADFVVDDIDDDKKTDLLILVVEGDGAFSRGAKSYVLLMSPPL